MLVVVFLFSSLGVGFAKPKFKEGVPPGLAKKMVRTQAQERVRAFGDIEGYKWAEKAIEKMYNKGVIKGESAKNFAPKRPVTKLEAVIMALRVMGWEDEAQTKLEIPKKYKGEAVAEWAKGYVALAVEKDILDEVDLLEFRSNEPAKRSDVAKYIVRAIDLENKAEDHMNDVLDFVDYPAMPVGAIGYIYVVNDMGLMIGNPDGTFQPNKPVTRAEMAVLIDRLDDKVDNEIDSNEKIGTVTDIDVDDLTITLDINDREKTYDILENAPVYQDKEYFDLGDVEEGYVVELLMNNDGEVCFLVIKEAKAVNEEEQTGVVMDIDVDELTTTLYINSSEKTYDLLDDTLVYEKEERIELEDVEIGDYIRLILNNDGEAITLIILNEEEQTGVVTDIDVEDLTITLDINDSEITYDLLDDTLVYEDEEFSELENIQEGYLVELSLDEAGNVRFLVIK